MKEEQPVLYMVVEMFTDAAAVYARFRERGRMLPDGLVYHASWVEQEGAGRCFQLMECEDPALLEQWADNWRDLAAFEFVPVVTSQEAATAHSG
jgi:hypothetical protein